MPSFEMLLPRHVAPGTHVLLWLGMALLCLPALVRALQCAKRYQDSGATVPHLTNMCKYCMSLATVLALAMHRATWPHLAYRVLYVSVASVTAAYALYWDFALDWGLCKRHAPARWLRKDLMYVHPQVGVRARGCPLHACMCAP